MFNRVCHYFKNLVGLTYKQDYIYILAVPDPALLGFDYFPIYNILIIAIPDS